MYVYIHYNNLKLSLCLSTQLAGLCMNRWCLEELVRRDPHNFLILLQKILKKTREVDALILGVMVQTLSLPKEKLQDSAVLIGAAAVPV